MELYVDASVVLRILGGEPAQLTAFRSAERPVSSALARVECLRAIDRGAVRGLAARLVADRRAAALETFSAFRLVPINRVILERAGEPFPTSIGTLDAIHLATALTVRSELPGLRFATHDVELGLAARSVGFEVEGLPA